MVVQQNDDKSLDQWLAWAGLDSNPFADYDAYAESSRLPEYFSDAGIFRSLIGDPLEPEPKIVFAPRGGGKTAYWVNLRHESQPSEAGGRLGRVLGVPHIRFERLWELQRRGSSITPYDHLCEILKYGVLNLLEVLTTDAARAAQFSPALYGRLRWLCDQFHPELLQPSSIQRYVERALGEFTFRWDVFERAVEQGKLTTRMREQSASACALFIARCVDAKPSPMSDKALPDEIMAEFVRIVRGADLDAVYVLMDQLDRQHEGEENVPMLLDVLKPLLDDQYLLQGDHWACKIFLPDDLREALCKPGTRTADFVRQHELRIVWTEKSLKDLLSLRLQYYSQDRLTSLDSLCQLDRSAAPAQTADEPPDNARSRSAHKDKTIEDDLIFESGNVPRKLLKLGQYLLKAHVSRAGGKDRLTRIDWQQALEHFYQDEGLGPLLLWLDPEEKRIFKGHRRIDLTDMEYELLKCLVEHKGYCDKETLTKIVWGPGQEYDPQLVGQLVKRVRRKIENDPRHPTFLVTEKPHGFRLQGLK